ncbi:hypothetical protein GGR54DRAFT_639014 [Hypoxylon sp. NC1633]|nr:hypothetical protein GGR54DRAFT_639014 [Hypoxylon sp. NC1633]
MAAEQRRPRGVPNCATSLDATLTLNTDMAVGAYSPVDSVSRVTPKSTSAGHAKSPGEGGMATITPVQSETSQTRSARSTSTTSRNAHRLSLTLPIAPPNSFPSRPTPTSSVPPTPIETSALSYPTDANDYIIAIATQERHVLELREELGRAEHDLRKLKRQWTASETYKKRAPGRSVEPPRATVATSDGQWGSEDNPPARYSSELERRKAILLAQSQGAPREHKRTVIRGGHTRTLSLLSPTNLTSEDSDGLPTAADVYSQPPPLPSPAPLNKRATWAPRQSQPSNGMKQIANDFKQGLWTFVEDLRQATVGDEAISGTTNRTSEMVSRLGRMESDQDTIRASAANRGRIPFQTEPEAIAETPSRSSTGSFSDRAQHRRTESRPESKTKKHFSWTPLTYDSFDDDDWSNWDTPNAKTSRWSGSTVNGDIITTVPERMNENEGTLRRKQSRSELRSPSPQTPSKLEELPQAILNRLTPSNIKNSTSNFIKEWERSLSAPEDTTSL